MCGPEESSTPGAYPTGIRVGVGGGPGAHISLLAPRKARKIPGWPIRQDAGKQGRPARTLGVRSGNSHHPLVTHARTVVEELPLLWPQGPVLYMPIPPGPQGRAGLLASSLGKESPVPTAAPAVWAVGAADRRVCYRCRCVLA